MQGPSPSPPAHGSVLRVILQTPLYWLLIAVPVAWGLHYWHAGDLWVFVASCLAIVPLAGLMGRATENLAERLGAALGGLLNATFGNAAELIIALVALAKGPKMYPLVKASLTGSIIGNVLLVLGLALVAGGLRHRRQTFNRVAASMGATLMVLAAIGLLMPTLYFYVFAAQHGAGGVPDQELVDYLSEEIACILAGVYVLSLVFSLVTHRNLFTDEDAARPGADLHRPPEWLRTQSLAVLVLSTLGVALMSEQLVGSVESAAATLGLGPVFVGVIVVAIVGNAAEHSTAVLVAYKNKMDLAVNIAVGSSIQVALLVAPVLVFASMVMGLEQPLDLHFSLLEIVALAIAIVALTLVSVDGESHWMEGVMLLAVYAILALAFYHLPEAAAVEPP